MNKKFYLGAVLLAALSMASGALTSCIDNDEPAGITELRSAKAELLRAKAALELAKAETEKQEANIKAAKAATEQAIAKQEEAKAALEKAKAEAEQARTDVEKAEAQKKIAKIQQQMLENEEKHKATMLELQKQTADNQKILEDALAYYESLKSLLPENVENKLTELKNNVHSAYTDLYEAQLGLYDAMQLVYEMTNSIDGIEAGLKATVAEAENALTAAENEVNRLQALYDAQTPTEWEEQIAAIDAYAKEAKLELAKLELAKQEIKESDGYKAAEQKVSAAETTLNKAKTTDTYAVTPIKIEVKNSYIQGKISSVLDKDKNLTSSYKDNKATYSQLTGENEQMAAAIKSWETAMKGAGISAEDVQVAKCELEDAKKAAAKAESTYNADVENWKKMHEQYETKTALVEVDNSKFDAAVKAYNASLKTLSDAVEAQNKAYDAAYKTAYDSKYNELMDAKKFDAAVNDIKTVLDAAGVAGFTPTAHKTVAQVKALISASGLTAEKQAETVKAVDDAITKAWKNKTQAEIEEIEKNSKETADAAAKTAVAKDEAYIKAKKAVTDATAVLNVTDKNDKNYSKSYAAFVAAVDAFDKTASEVAQVRTEDAKKLNADNMTGIGAKIAEAGKETKDENSFAVTDGWTRAKVVANAETKKYEEKAEYLEVIRTEVSEASVKKFETVEFSETLAETAWVNASNKAFGTTAGVHSQPAIADCTGGSAKANVDAQNTLKDKQDKADAIADAETINNAIAAAKATLASEVAAAKTAVETAQTAVTTAKKDLEKLTKEQDDAITKINTKLTSDAKIKEKAQKVVKAYYTGAYYEGTNISGTISDIEDMKETIKFDLDCAKEDLEEAKVELKDAQELLQKFEETGDFNDIAIAELYLASAMHNLEDAQEAYDYAVAQLNAYTEAIAK